jgi:hypothetical protein
MIRMGVGLRAASGVSVSTNLASVETTPPAASRAGGSFTGHTPSEISFVCLHLEGGESSTKWEAGSAMSQRESPLGVTGRL